MQIIDRLLGRVWPNRTIIPIVAGEIIVALVIHVYGLLGLYVMSVVLVTAFWLYVNARGARNELHSMRASDRFKGMTRVKYCVNVLLRIGMSILWGLFWLAYPVKFSTEMRKAWIATRRVD